MSAIFAVLSLLVACATADAPPLPYAAAASSQSFPPAFTSHGEETPTGPYVQQYGHGTDGFGIQSGYEGYLVPTANGAQKTVLLPVRDSLGYLSSTTGLTHLIKYISAKGLKIIPKIVLSVVGIAGLFLLGCVVTTAVCSFTPFCTISFLGWGLARENMRSFLTEDRISATAAFVAEAIKKYQEIYGTEDLKTKNENKIKK